MLKLDTIFIEFCKFCNKNRISFEFGYCEHNKVKFRRYKLTNVDFKNPIELLFKTDLDKLLVLIWFMETFDKNIPRKKIYISKSHGRYYVSYINHFNSVVHVNSSILKLKIQKWIKDLISINV
jgi:hypothetical protein